MTHFKVTHSGFKDVYTPIEFGANSLIVKGAERAADLVARLRNCGSHDAAAVELSAAEYAVERAARMPKVGV